LLTWFRQAKRDLPWRRTKDPYAVWISEVMLQQTQVATVIPYWERFLSRFPDVKTLASAPVDDVLALWSGLGYYARARNLHRAAGALANEHAGRFPRSLSALRALPGFGPYTAAAVGSIALGLDAALVDGNVARVLCRLEGWRLGSEAAREKAWVLAPELIPVGEAGDWNQALMELGATVCTPQAPRCDACPVASLCPAKEQGDPAQYPLAKVRRARKQLRYAAIAIREAQSVLLIRRDEKGLFGGLWDLPSREVVGEVDSETAARALCQTLVARTIVPERLGRVSQALTHRDVTVDVFSAPSQRVRVPEGGRWVAETELATLGLSTLAVKVLRAAGVTVPEGHGRRSARPAAGQLELGLSQSGNPTADDRESSGNGRRIPAKL
jgi:A/G-specific adenine glycosylase